jgi:hypothetical protein
MAFQIIRHMTFYFALFAPRMSIFVFTNENVWEDANSKIAGSKMITHIFITPGPRAS